MKAFGRSTIVLAGTLALGMAANTYAASPTAPADDIYQTIFQSVDQSRMDKLLQDLTGGNPITLAGQTFSITDRYLPASKANFRTYFTNYFQNLGLTVSTLAYPTQYNLETQGHNVEAILPGKSADTIVIIVHYDSIGPHGSDNPGVDDDMTGMATMMETARLLVPYQARLEHTVRFVAADYEEWGDLEGARNYAKYIQALAAQKGFKIISAIDDEQSGWKEGDNSFDIFTCGGDSDAISAPLGDLLASTASTYGKIATTRGCIGQNSDHYAFWEISVPAVVFSEHDPFGNPHFDAEGGDTFDKIDLGYYFEIAQVGVTFAARVVGIDP